MKTLILVLTSSLHLVASAFAQTPALSREEVLNRFPGTYVATAGVEEYCGKYVTIAREARLAEQPSYLLTLVFTFSNGVESSKELFEGAEAPNWNYGYYLQETHTLAEDAVMSTQSRRPENGKKFEVSLVRRISIPEAVADDEETIKPALKIEFAKKERDLGTKRSVVCQYQHAVR